MKKRIIGTLLSIIIILPVIFSLTGCSPTPKVKAEDMMAEVEPNQPNVTMDISQEDLDPIKDFSIALFKESLDNEKNTLVSPLSVIYALGMTANGAANKTLAQMEEVFGLSIGELNEVLYAYDQMMPSGKKYKFSIANSIWFRDNDSLIVEKDFLQTNANWYGATIYKAPFDDSTVVDINTWVKDKTDGMIEEIVGEIPDSSMLYLINALTFDAEWEDIYQESQIHKEVFTKEDGTRQEVDFMYSDESKYLEDDMATGFLKPYADGKYAFVALLPNEGVKVADYVSSLTSNNVSRLLNSMEDVTVMTAIPKFKTEYDIEMSEILESMGMPDAFDEGLADFSKMASLQEGKLFISQVKHKTFLALDEKGTRAGAVTSVEMAGTSAPVDIKQVYLDRPFVYMIIDSELNMPIFIGTTMEI
jgi:serpin B